MEMREIKIIDNNHISINGEIFTKSAFSINGLLNEAKIRYPIGTIVECLYEHVTPPHILTVAGHDLVHPIGRDEYVYFPSIEGPNIIVHKHDKWARIIKGLDNEEHIPDESILQKSIDEIITGIKSLKKSFLIRQDYINASNLRTIGHNLEQLKGEITIIRRMNAFLMLTEEGIESACKMYPEDIEFLIKNENNSYREVRHSLINELGI